MTQQAEQAIIGSLLMEPQSVSRIIKTVRPEMFSDAMLGRAYGAFVQAYEDGKPVNEITIVADICKTELESDIISAELTKCLAIRCFPSELESYAEVLVKGFTSRRLKNLISITPNPGAVNEQLSMLIEDLQNLQDESASKDGVNAAELVESCKGLYFNPNRVPGLKLGFSKLDDIIGGIDPGDMALIGARPAVGKSSLASQIVLTLAKSGHKVALFNLEMATQQIYERFLSYETGIGLTRIRKAQCFLGDEEKKVREAHERIVKLSKNLTVYSGSRSIAELKSECRRHKFDVVIVDYLQLLEADDIYKGDRYAEVSSISGDLKRLAMNMHIPIIALSQLNRGSERAAEKEPTMADLRETGNLEQDASVIVLLWNLDPENKELKGCKVEKNRQGLTGTVKMRFDGSQMRFEEIRDEESYQNAKNKVNNNGEKKGTNKYERYRRDQEEPQFDF